MSPTPGAPAPAFRYFWVLLAGATIISIAMGVRQSYGLVIGPLSALREWPVATFSLALAVQNLLWGVAQPVTAALAEKYGAEKVGVIGGLLYALGLALTAFSDAAGVALAGSGALVGLALSGTTFGVILGVIGRAAPPEKRSSALGIASAGGSAGQLLVVPLADGLIGVTGVEGALYALGALAVIMAPLSALLAEPHLKGANAGGVHPSLSAALGSAWGDRSFRLLTAGFFVCGFQVAFVGVHLPMYLSLCHMPPALGPVALMVIGGFNIIGSWGCGVLGQHFKPRKVLSLIYLLRAIIVALFVSLPTTMPGVILFAATMGLLWLGTVPLTSQIIAQHHGTRYMGTLFGLVFFSHQVGSFVGVYMGGALLDATGSYDIVWWASVALGIVAALIHLPIADEPQTAPATA